MPPAAPLWPQAGFEPPGGAGAQRQRTAPRCTPRGRRRAPLSLSPHITAMQKLLLTVDRVSTWFGKACAWTVVGLTLLITWEVFSRYVLNKPHAWVLDAQIMLYGVLFMMAGAYTLAKNGHVRGDVLYGFFAPRTQATVDLVLYVVFFLPGVIAMTYAGWYFFQDSLAMREQTFNADPIPVYPFKFVVPVAGALLLLQGIVEIIRCVICLRTGAWPSREEDVEEVDVDKLKQMVHVKDADIDALDRLVVTKGTQP